MDAAERAARWLRQRAAYEPRDASLFAAALTHRSAGSRNNERLEFLGDSVVNLVIAQYLYERFGATDEGALSRLRSRVVSGESLAQVATQLELGEVLELGPGELKSGGHRRASILADAFEAVCAALYLESGLETARRIILQWLQPALQPLTEQSDRKDPKTELQEWLQGRSLPLPVYALESVAGEAHEQQFTVRCEAAGVAATATGCGSSRRRAEQAAAAAVLQLLDGRQRPVSPCHDA